MLSALRRGCRIAVRRPRAAAWTLIAAACALFVAGAALLAADTVDRWASVPRGSSDRLVVYLGDGVTDAAARSLVGDLSRVPGVVHAELVSAADSAHRLEHTLGVDAALLDGVDLASLPGSVEVALAPGERDVVAMSPTIRALRGAPGIADVELAAAAPDPDAHIAPTARLIAWAGATALAILAAIVVLAALRLRLERDPRERAVHALLGASPAFSIVPAALAGALTGAAAAALAAVAILVGLGHVAAALAIEVAPPALAALAAFVGLGAALGLCGGVLAGSADAR